MRLEFKAGGKTFCLYLPLSGVLLRVLLRFSLGRKAKGQGSDDVSEEGAGALTDGERKAISDFAAKAVKELKRYRKKFGRFALLEASEKDGDFFRLLI